MSQETETTNNKRRGAKISSGTKLIAAGLVLLAAVGLLFQFSEKPNPHSPLARIPPPADNMPGSKPSNGSISQPQARNDSSALPAGTGPLIEIDTEVGKIRIELYPTQAPAAVAQLIKLTKSGYYNSDTLMQSRAGLGVAIAKLGQSIKTFDFKDESNKLTSRRGSVAIAKSSASPAYLNNIFFGYDSQPELEKHYIIIGQIVGGLELIEQSLSGQRLKVNSFKLIARPD